MGEDMGEGLSVREGGMAMCGVRVRIRLGRGKSLGLYGEFVGWADGYIVVIAVIPMVFIYAWRIRVVYWGNVTS